MRQSVVPVVLAGAVKALPDDGRRGGFDKHVFAWPMGHHQNGCENALLLDAILQSGADYLKAHGKVVAASVALYP